MVQNLGRTKIILRVEEISAKDDILDVEGKELAHIVNKKKISLEMTPW